VHYHKSFGVLQELFDHRDFQGFEQDLRDCAASGCESVEGPRFLDLGCAPGGFAACLLQDHILGPMSVGYGVSLPPQLGGFQMAITTSRLCVQFEDLLQINSCDLMCIDNSIDICVADAQYLSNMFKPQHQTAKYRGMKTRSRTLGIWALTVKECQLAFAKLRQSGSFIFRFGWRGVGSSDVHPSGEPVHPSLLAKYLQEEEWYTALTHWLFSVLKSLFNTLRPFKSEYVHQADVSFYMVCRNFDREKFELRGWEAKLQRAYHELTNCEDEATLVAGLKEAINEDTKLAIDGLLEYVGRMRAIGIQSRKVTNPKALAWKSTIDENQKEKEAPKEETVAKEEEVEDTTEKVEEKEDKVEEKEEKLETDEKEKVDEKVVPGSLVKSDTSTELEERSESSSATTLSAVPEGDSALPAGQVVLVPPPPPPPSRGSKVPKAPGRCTPEPKREIRGGRPGKGPGPTKQKQAALSGEWSSPTWDARDTRDTRGGERSWDSGRSQWNSWDASDFDAPGDWGNFVVPDAYEQHMFPKLPMDLDTTNNYSEVVHGFEAMYQVEHFAEHQPGHLGMENSLNGFMCEDASMALHQEALGMEVHDPMMMDASMALHQDAVMDGLVLQEGANDAMMQVDMVPMTWTPLTSYTPVPGSLPPPPAAPPMLGEVLGYDGYAQQGNTGLTMSSSTPAVASTAPIVTVQEPEVKTVDDTVAPVAQRPAPSRQPIEAPEAAYDLASEEEEESRPKRRRRRKDREEKRDDGERRKRGAKDRTVLRAIRQMHREGKGYRAPWYRRLKAQIRAAVLDIHQDSLQALRFGICFAMAWSFCSLVMSMIRFSSQVPSSVA